MFTFILPGACRGQADNDRQFSKTVAVDGQGAQTWQVKLRWRGRQITQPTRCSVQDNAYAQKRFDSPDYAELFRKAPVL